MLLELISTSISAFIFLYVFVYLPGKVSVYKIKKLQYWDVQVALGIAFLSLSLFLGKWVLPTQWVLLTYISFFLLLSFFWKIPLTYFRVTLNAKKAKKYLGIILVLVVGTAAQAITFIRTIFFSYQELTFAVFTNHDQSWHASLIHELTQSFPPQIPGFSGEILKNYHYFYDLIIAANLEVVGGDIYVAIQVVYPILIALLLGISVWRISTFLTTSSVIQGFVVLLSFLGNNLAYVLNWFSPINWQSDTFLLDQPIIFLFNQQTVLSIALILYALVIANRYLSKKNDYYLGTLLAILWTSLIFIKFYAFIVLSLVFFVYLLLSSMIQRSLVRPVRQWLFPGLTMILLTGSVFMLAFSLDRSLLSLKAGWVLTTLLEKELAPLFPRLNGLYQAYISEGSFFHLTGFYAGLFIIFLLGNYGVRLLSFFSVLKQKKTPLFIFLYLLLIIPLLVVLLGYQQASPFNIIQFAPYSTIVSFLLLIPFLEFTKKRLSNNSWFGVLFVLFLISIPTTWKYLSGQFHRPSYEIQPSSIDVLLSLKEHDYGSVLWLKANYRSKNSNLIGAVAKKRSVFSDVIQLEVLQVDYEGRLTQLETIYSDGCSARMKPWLTEEIHPDYLIIPTGTELFDCYPELDELHNNPDWTVYRPK